MFSSYFASQSLMDLAESAKGLVSLAKRSRT